MNFVSTFCLPFALAITFGGGAFGTQPSGNLQATLRALDESSAKFVSAQANFKKEIFTKLVNDTEYQDGSTYVIHGKGGTELGIKVNGQGARTLIYKAGVARDYNPAIKCYDTYSETDAKRKGTIESLLALSFGASGKELDSNWTVTDLGPDTITADGKAYKVEKLNLVPKDQGLRNNIKSVALWTDLSTAIALKQVVNFPTGDTQTAIYSNIRLNKDVDKSPFKIEGKPCK
jgi:hypothetical protein